MRTERPSGGPDLARLLAIAAGVIVMVVVLLTVFPFGSTAPAPPYPPPPVAGAVEPIPAEALVFRMHPEDVAVAPDAPARRPAQPRTLAIYRSLRAYPGAPPRVPHGLTEEEFRETRCLTCHLRGGYAARFGGYAPVTPHPEYASCLQCHSADAMRVGIALPGQVTDVVCSQCHVDPGRPPPSLVSLNWRPLQAPAQGFRAMDGSPPVIPHDLELRGNCIACHAGPGAVRAIRTTHPERANCRQCHVTASDDAVFSRPLNARTVPDGGTP